MSSTQWRIYIRGVTGGEYVAGIAEVEMHTSIGGANVCSGGTASASTCYAGSPGPYDADKALDGNISTFWDSDTNLRVAPQWWQYTFASAQTIVEFSITSPPSGNLSNTPSWFELQYYDGASWVAVIHRLETDWTAGEKRTFSANTLAKSAWRIYVTDNGGTAVDGIAEITMHTTIGGSNICTGGGSSQSGCYLGWPGSYNSTKAFDADPATFWDSNSGSPQWVYYKTASSNEIVEFTLQAATGYNTGDAPKDFQIQYWDGTDWVTKGTWTGLSWTSGEIKTFSWPSVSRHVNVFVNQS